MKGITRWRWCLAALIVGLSATAQGEVFDPEYEHYVAPVYPAGMNKKEVNGRVRLSYRVHNDGSVSEVKVLSKTHRTFANAALYAVARWRFLPWTVSQDKPAYIDGKVKFWFGEDLTEEDMDVLCEKRKPGDITHVR